MQWRPRSAGAAASGTRTSSTSCARRCPAGSSSCSSADASRPRTGETYYENARGEGAFGREVGEPDAWMLGEDSGIEVAALGGRPGIRVGALGRATVSRGCSTSSPASSDRRARYVCELVALAPDGEELRGPGILEGAIATERRGERGLRLRPDLRPRRRGAHRRRARQRLEARELPPRPRGRRAARPSQRPDDLEPGPVPADESWPGMAVQARPATLPRPAGVPPVDLGAEDDHVRHHVEPDEQERGRAERLHGDDLAREADEERQHLEGRLQQHRRERGARPDLAQRQSAFVRRRTRRRGRRTPPRSRRAPRRVGDDALATKPGANRLRMSQPTEPTTSATKSTISEPTMKSDASNLPRRNGAVRASVDDVERRLEHAEERERRPEQEPAADEPERRRVAR